MKEVENRIAQKMDLIQDTFLRIQDIFFKAPDWRGDIKDLVEANVEFRSIAYESASMSIALDDLKQNNQLANWLEFVNTMGKAHATQVHVGLGWAFAQTLTPPMDYLPLFHPMQRYRVLDGYGYYESLFRRRRSIMHHLKLNLGDATASGALDQGIGRGTWYLNKGDFAATKEMIAGFQPERHNDLYRGLGIAIAYVGGATEETLMQIIAAAGNFKTQLATGAAMALISRHKAGYITNDAELACKVFSGKSAAEVIKANETITAAINTEANDAYLTWITGIEKFIH
jgi:hypothetical protein